MITPLLLSVLSLQEGGWSPPPPPPVVPTPVASQPRFAPFVLPETVRIVATEDGLEPQMVLLQDTLEKRLGRRIPLGEAPAKSGDLTLTLGYLSDAVQGNPEAYSIEVFDDHVALSATGSVGIARAIARLAQLFSHDSESGAWVLPPTRIDDAPADPWRGLLLDVARFPHSVESLRESIDMAFLFSLSVVHLHLGDDQAFTFPASCLPPRTDPGQPGAHRGYTLEDLRYLVRYADARGITLVPEIDMPAHASALVRARPDLFGTTDAETGEAKSTGVINMASPAAVEATKALVDEVISVFDTSPYFHLGGDEVWAPGLLKLPEFLALAEKVGLPLKAEEGAVNALLNHFLQDMADHVTEAGLQPIVWEGFKPVKGGKTLDTGAWVMSWSQHSQMPEALQADGYTLINCGWEPLYIVPAQSWASQAADAFDWTPRSVRQRYGGRRAELQADSPLQGAQICVWEQRPEAIVPAVLGVLPELSERMWGSHGTPETYADFAPLADAAQAVVRDMLRPAVVTWTSDLGGQELLFRDEVSVTLAAAAHAAPGVIRYVTGPEFGQVPTPESPAATEKPMVLKESTVVAAALFAMDGRRIGGITEVRFEKGVPVMSFDAYRLDQGSSFTAADFDDLSEPALIGSGQLMGATPARIDAINREQFARVAPEAHIDLRPIAWDRFGAAGQRMDAARPRLYGRHAVRARGQVTVDFAGTWAIEFKSRDGVGRIRIGDAEVTCSGDNQIVRRTAELEVGTYAVFIYHAMVDVHNDLQVWLTPLDPEGVFGDSAAKTPLGTLLRPTTDLVGPEDLLPLASFRE